MKNLKMWALAIAAVCLFAGVPVSATQLTVSSYSMNNGATGGFDYHDFTYLPCPGNNCNITGAYLSGGTGKLTDGVSPSLNWGSVWRADAVGRLGLPPGRTKPQHHLQLRRPGDRQFCHGLGWITVWEMAWCFCRTASRSTATITLSLPTTSMGLRVATR